MRNESKTTPLKSIRSSSAARFPNGKVQFENFWISNCTIGSCIDKMNYF